MENESYSYKLYSHPDKLLKDHLCGVHKIGKRVFEKERFESILNSEVLSAILLLHDFGKASIDFQNKLFGKTFHVQKSFHSEISAVILLLYLEYKSFSIEEQILGYITIKKHHGSFNSDLEELLEIDDSRIEYLYEIFSNIDLKELCEIYRDYLDLTFFDSQLLSETIKSFGIRKYKRIFNKFIKNVNNFDAYNRLNNYFSILVYSDKEDCILNDSEILNKKIVYEKYNAVTDYKKKKFTGKLKNQIDEIREKSFKEVENNIDLKNRIFSINLPTGSGKTLTSLNAALKILEKDNSLERIIYCLPFTSIIDQNADIFQEVLDTEDNSVLLKHHHLSEINYNSDFYNNEIFNDQQAEYLIETWNSKIIVTTFYQFLHSLLTGENNLLKKYNKIKNSIVILDEVQSIPRKYWILVNNYLKFISEKMNCYILLVTATMPLIFSEEENEIKELATSKREYFNAFSRIILDVKDANKKTSIRDFSIRLIEELRQSDKSILVICNTIKSSLFLYDKLKENGFAPLYLSSNIIPKDRLNIIKRIKKDKIRALISTQVIEAGVDISFDIVYRDMAPLDSIFQACGRCNRNGNNIEKGIVKIIKLTDDKNLEYSSYIYDEVILSRTSDLFRDKSIIEEKQFLDLANEYFKIMKNATSTSLSIEIINAIKYLDYKKAFYEKESFRLIDNNFRTISCFVESDESASDLLNEYNNLKLDIRSFENKTKLKKILREMSKYIINVPEKFLKTTDSEKIFIIEKSMLTQYYSSLTGFKRDEKQKDYIF